MTVRQWNSLSLDCVTVRSTISRSAFARSQRVTCSPRSSRSLALVAENTFTPVNIPPPPATDLPPARPEVKSPHGRKRSIPALIVPSGHQEAAYLRWRNGVFPRIDFQGRAAAASRRTTDAHPRAPRPGALRAERGRAQHGARPPGRRVARAGAGGGISLVDDGRRGSACDLAAGVGGVRHRGAREPPRGIVPQLPQGP